MMAFAALLKPIILGAIALWIAQYFRNKEQEQEQERNDRDRRK